jgi:hypothetical protein
VIWDADGNATATRSLRVVCCRDAVARQVALAEGGEDFWFTGCAVEQQDWFWGRFSTRWGVGRLVVGAFSKKVVDSGRVACNSKIPGDHSNRFWRSIAVIRL